MNIIKISAFSDGDSGGNPAGVALLDEMPSAVEMQKVAAEVGFSETVFASLQDNTSNWRVRYFSPESEVPFCGHATIALGAALAKAHGSGRYQLTLNSATISVEGKRKGDQFIAALQSPQTHYELMNEQEIDETLELLSYDKNQLSDEIAPARIHGGADHLVLALKSREALASMRYRLDTGRDFMRKRGLVTIMLVFAETESLFHVRNAFASGGVLEDPATGAAAAAFAGYIRDSGWPNDGKIEIIQGEDMGARSLITAEFNSEASSSVQVSGATREIR